MKKKKYIEICKVADEATASEIVNFLAENEIDAKTWTCEDDEEAAVADNPDKKKAAELHILVDSPAVGEAHELVLSFYGSAVDDSTEGSESQEACPHCGAWLREEYTVCPSCRARLST